MKIKLIGNFTIAILSILLTATALIGCTSRAKEKDVSQPLPSASVIPDYTLQDVVHYHYDFGILRIKVFFKRGVFFTEKDELHVENCRFVYYDSNGVIESRGESKKATLYENESYLVARDDVIVISEVNGARLETDYLE